MEELPAGIRRITLPLPTRPGHVHAYLLPGDEGWTLVDTGIGTPDAKETWAAELEQAGEPVPDDVAATADDHRRPDDHRRRQLLLHPARRRRPGHTSRWSGWPSRESRIRFFLGS